MIASSSTFRRHLGKVILDLFHLLHASVYSDYQTDAEASGYILSNGAGGLGSSFLPD